MPLNSDTAPDDSHAVPSNGSYALKILYVEDNRMNAILFEEAMRMNGGVELQLAENGHEALSLVERWIPDVLVLDAHLPDIDGYQLLTRLRQIDYLQYVPAFMCSADVQVQDVKRAAQWGFVGYWPKPIDLNRVFADVNRLKEELNKISEDHPL
jgi:CheY-like chemotaxis protein